MATVDLNRKGRVVLFRMKSAQFLELPASEHFRLELLNGEVVMSARPGTGHQHFVFRLGMALHNWIEPRGLGLLLPEIQLELDDEWMPIPDLVFVKAAHLDQVEAKLIRGPVDLAVEVLSPNDEKADRETKFTAYARFGVPWYWIVDLEQRQLEEYKLAGRAYGKPVVAPFDKPFRPRLFKGLILDLAAFELRRP